MNTGKVLKIGLVTTIVAAASSVSAAETDNEWRQNYSGIGDNNPSWWAADLDGGGHKDFEEFVLGINPTVADAAGNVRL